MAIKGGVKGFEQVRARLSQEVLKLQTRTMAGLLDAAILIRRDMEDTPPLIPVDTGNLRASWFTLPYESKNGPAVQLGFTANYATFVHEAVDHKFKRPGSGAKFFEAALKRNEKEILAAIAGKARIR